MQAQVLDIVDKRREFFGMPCSLADYETVDMGTIPAIDVIDNPDVSVHCADRETGRVIFTELASDVDLTSVPFVYQAQHDHAQRLYAIEYDHFFELFALSGPSGDGAILIHTPGRSGSTLLSRILSASGTVASLSEPDIFTQMPGYRMDGASDDELVRLCRTAVNALLSKVLKGRAKIGAIKFRNQCLASIDLLDKACPNAHHVFIHRQPLDTIHSFYRLGQRAGLAEPMPIQAATQFLADYYSQPVDEIADHLASVRWQDDIVSPLAFSTMFWAVAIHCFMQRKPHTMSLYMIDYDELRATPKSTISELFTYCNLPLSGVGSALQALDVDSQAGTALAQDISSDGIDDRLSAAQVDEVSSILDSLGTVKKLHTALNHS